MYMGWRRRDAEYRIQYHGLPATAACNQTVTSFCSRSQRATCSFPPQTGNMGRRGLPRIHLAVAFVERLRLNGLRVPDDAWG